MIVRYFCVQAQHTYDQRINSIFELHETMVSANSCCPMIYDGRESRIYLEIEVELFVRMAEL